MKKLVMVLANVVLITTSVTSMTAMTYQPTSMRYVGSHQKATTEDAEDIASKLWNQTVKVDPHFWLNKDIKTKQADFNKAIVADGILTADEVQYVSWGDLTINEAGWFKNKGDFTVSKDGSVATGTVSVNASTGETTQQIATKISTATNVKLNYNYWNNKHTQSELSVLRTILVNEHVLTKAEVSVITSVNATKITKAGQITLNLTVNDYKTSSNALLHANVVNDGHSASQIANSLNGYGFGLKTNTLGMYADTSYVEKNFVDLAVANYGLNINDLNYVILPHVKLAKDNPNTPVTVLKDGQTATAKMDLECKTGPYIYYYIVKNNDFQAYVNLNPYLVKQLQNYFPGHGHQKDLEYFYSMLCDKNCDYLPSYNGTLLIPWANRLNENMGPYGPGELTVGKIIKAQLHAGKNETVKNFEEQLASAVMNSNGYLSVMWEWTYSDHFLWYDFNTVQWKIW